MVLSAEAVNMLRELELSLGSTTTDHRGPSWPFSSWLQSQLVHILHEWSHEPDTSTPLPHARQDTTKTNWLYIFFTDQDIRTKPMKGIYISDGKDIDKFSLNSYVCDRKPNRMHKKSYTHSRVPSPVSEWPESVWTACWLLRGKTMMFVSLEPVATKPSGYASSPGSTHTLVT